MTATRNPLDELAAQPGAALPVVDKTINHEAERAVIAALMRHPDGKEIIRLGIAANLFDHPPDREAFAAIASFIADGIPPDAATLRSALSGAALIEVETSLQEHASAANLPVYVNLLKACQRERLAQAARDRLVKAAAAGAPDHELQAILESVRQVGQTEPGKGRFLDVGELCALPPTENWLMKNYLTRDSLTVLFGDPGCGKSFLAIDIACHVATGTPWRGCPVKPGKVLYIAGEGRNGLSKRFRAWFERHGEPPRNIQICTAPIALTDPAGIAALVAEIKAMPEAPALIVVDTINRNFGPGDENATADMTRAVAGLDAIRNATGAAILAAHHSGHGDKTRGRGSSVLRASVDVEYAVEKFDRTVQVRCTKAKDFDHPAPLAWTLEKQPLPWADEDGTPLDSAVLESGELHEPPPPPNTARMGGNQTKALETLRALYRTQQATLVQAGTDPGTARVTKADWYAAMKAAGLSRNRCTDSRAELVRRGLVRDEDGFVYLADAVPDFAPDFVPDLYRTVPESAKASCTVPYQGTYRVPGTPVHEAGALVCGTGMMEGDHEPNAAAVQPVDNSLPAGASDGARELWEVLKHVQGSETADRLAQKIGRNTARVIAAAQELRGFERASISGAFIGPIHPNEAVF